MLKMRGRHLMETPTDPVCVKRIKRHLSKSKFRSITMFYNSISRRRRSSLVCLVAVLISFHSAWSFSVETFRRQRCHLNLDSTLQAESNEDRSSPTTAAAENKDNEWISVLGKDNDAVLLRPIRDSSVLGSSSESDRQHPTGTKISISYQGTISELGWTTPQSVIDCWLREQQGLDESVAKKFLAEDVTGAMLLDSTQETASFTEDFVLNALGVTNKIQCKKLVMAARRLAKDYESYPPGTVFDNAELYTFTLGKSRLISAMELAAGQHFHEGAQVELLCRSDYAYGKEGLRTMKGDVMVPPFASLSFNINVLKVVPPEDDTL